jgi:sulfite exporter TauE/SafE
MTGALLLTAALMGLAGTPHCAAMCAAGCAAVARRCQPQRPGGAVAGLLVGRLVAYAVAGALAASLVGGLRWLAVSAGWLRPVWTGLQVFLLVLGVWMLLKGRLPEGVAAWLEGRGRSTLPEGAARIRLPGEVKAAAWGLLWPALPCGLLHAALLLAAVASTPLEGAAVMAVFAVTSGLGLLVGPAIWLRWVPMALRTAGGGAGVSPASLSLRLAGATIAVLVGWSLGHRLWTDTLAAWCA